MYKGMMKSLNWRKWILFCNRIDSHVCTILVRENSKDPTNKLTRVLTELQIFENEMKKIQRDYESALKIIKATKRDLAMSKENDEKYRNDFQVASQEIKEVKEKVKGNMSLIQAREILWNDIIHTVRNIWESLSIVE